MKVNEILVLKPADKYCKTFSGIDNLEGKSVLGLWVSKL